MQRKAEKQKNKAEKQKYKAEKAKIKAEKRKLKEEKKLLKEQKKLEREERKQAKLEFAQKLEKARIEELPIKQQRLLELWIDGWNISGCFGGRVECLFCFIFVFRFAKQIISHFQTVKYNKSQKQTGLTVV